MKKFSTGGLEGVLPQPVFRILGVAFLPELEVELVFAGEGVDGAEDLTGLDFFAGLDGDRLQFAVEGEIGTVLDQDALVVAGE